MRTVEVFNFVSVDDLILYFKLINCDIDYFSFTGTKLSGNKNIFFECKIILSNIDSHENEFSDITERKLVKKIIEYFNQLCMPNEKLKEIRNDN